MEEMFTFLGMGSSSHENYFLNENMLLGKFVMISIGPINNYITSQN